MSKEAGATRAGALPRPPPRSGSARDDGWLPGDAVYPLVPGARAGAARQQSWAISNVVSSADITSGEESVQLGESCISHV